MAGIFFGDLWRSVMGGPEDGGAGGAEGGGCAFNTPVARSVPLEPEEATARVEELVPQLVERRYKLLALDFDQTIISEHTGGMWAGTAEELARFVRPVMAALLRAASAADELQLAVVTFSGQIAIVRAVLASVVGEGAASRIAIRGADGSWPVPAGAPQGGKMPHLHSVWALLAAAGMLLVMVLTFAAFVDLERCDVEIDDDTPTARARRRRQLKAAARRRKKRALAAVTANASAVAPADGEDEADDAEDEGSRSKDTDGLLADDAV